MNRNKMTHLLNNWKFNWRRKPFVTYILLALMIIMYVIMSLNGGSQNPFTLMFFGAKVNELIRMGEWWRLLTPAFLHIGLSHILFNGLVVFYLGSQLEYIIGHFRYLLLFVLSAIMGNAASFALNDAISAGASTAIFGFFASTIVLAKFFPRQSGIQQLSRNYLALIGLNIVWGLLSNNVDNAGHIGGLIGGYLSMYAISTPGAGNNNQERVKYAIIYLLIFVVFLLVGFFSTSSLFF